MSKKHIIHFGYRCYAVDSITAATAAVALLSKLQLCHFNSDADQSKDWYYEPDNDRDNEIKLKMNQDYREPKPVKPAKALSLPAPKRGSILCMCERSYVAPKQTCPSCGLAFNVSHSRTHQDTPTAISPTLRLV